MLRPSAHPTPVVARVCGALACGAVLVGCGSPPTASVPADPPSGTSKPPATTSTAADPAPQPTGTVAAVEILRDWHARRAAAFVSGDPAQVRSLYAPSGTAADADVALLRVYDARGLRVLDLRTTVAGVRLVRWTEDRLDLRARERVARAVVAGAGGEQRALPYDGWHRRRVVLTPEEGTWVVSSVRGWP